MTSSEAILAMLLQELSCRTGFNPWWDQIDVDIRAELMAKLLGIIQATTAEDVPEHVQGEFYRQLYGDFSDDKVDWEYDVTDLALGEEPDDSTSTDS